MAINNSAADAGPTTLADLLSSSGPIPSSSTYLNDLTSLPLTSLRSEPTELSSTSAQLTNALTTLCTASYPTFLSLHTSSSSLSSTLNSLSTSLSSLLTTLPALQSSATSFTENASPLLAERRHALLVRDKSSPLSDVLELPRLIDASIRHGAFGDALDLAQHAQALAAQFPEIALVQDVASECFAAQRALLASLLTSLSERGRTRLPALFRACGFLRRMNLLTEPELALAFLSGRLSALTATLDALESDVRSDDAKDAHSRFLRRFVDAWREGVQDGIAQFGTIFLEKSSALNGGGMSTPSAASPSAPNQEEMLTLHSLLSHWSSLLLFRLMTVLPAHLAQARSADASVLPALLTQLTYAGVACARLGLDFRPLLARPFGDAVRDGVCTELESTRKLWENRIKAAQKRKLSPSRWLIIQSLASDPPEASDDEDDPDGKGKKPPHLVPRVLASYPPLAELTNSLLTSLNGLRLLAPKSVLPALLGAMDESLSGCAASLWAYVQELESEGGELGEKEEKVLKAAGAVLVRTLIPFARRALVEGVFGIKVGKENGGKLTKASGDGAKRLREKVGIWEEWLNEDSEDETEGEEDGELKADTEDN
jgi:hypothetical protein